MLSEEIFLSSFGFHKKSMKEKVEKFLG